MIRLSRLRAVAGFSPDLHLGLLTVGLRTVTLGSKFILLLGLARSLAPEDLGVFGLMTAALSFGVVALGLEFHAFAIREMVEADARGRARMIRNQLIFFALSTSLVLPLFLLLFVTTLPWTLLGWFYGLIILEYLSHESARILIALGRPFAANVILFLRSGAWAYPVLAYFAWTHHASLEYVWIAWLVGLVASLILAANRLSTLPWHGIFRDDIDWRWIFAGVRTAPPFLITAGSALGLMYVDRFFIQAFGTLKDVGIYTFFGGLTVALHTLVHTGVLSLRIPRIISAARSKDVERLEREMSSLLARTVSAALVMAVPMAIAIFPLTLLVGHPEYRAHLDTFFVLLAAAVIRCVAEVPVYRLYATGQDIRLLAVNLGSFAVIVLGNLALVPLAGIRGAAIASVLAGISLGLGALACSKRKLG